MFYRKRSVLSRDAVKVDNVQGSGLTRKVRRWETGDRDALSPVHKTALLIPHRPRNGMISNLDSGVA
jgi:hypothetical protein